LVWLKPDNGNNATRRLQITQGTCFGYIFEEFYKIILRKIYPKKFSFPRFYYIPPYSNSNLRCHIASSRSFFTFGAFTIWLLINETLQSAQLKPIHTHLTSRPSIAVKVFPD
jgi:hypothetical protein